MGAEIGTTTLNNQDVFTDIYQSNYWRDKESVSGPGSNLKSTEHLRKVLPPLLTSMGVKSLLDIPCGDFYWFNKMWPHLNLEWYLGADIVPLLVEQNRHAYTRPNVALYFDVLNAVDGLLPEVDLILCRDLLGHLPNADVAKAIRNFRRSDSRWLLATTFPKRDNGNGDIKAGQWRPINLNDWKFGLGEPIMLIDEKATGKFADKHLGLWEINDGHGH